MPGAAMCLCRWCFCQLVQGDTAKGAISTQLAVIASTLFWWAAGHCEMTKHCLSRAIGRQSQPNWPWSRRRRRRPAFVLYWVPFVLSGSLNLLLCLRRVLLNLMPLSLFSAGDVSPLPLKPTPCKCALPFHFAYGILLEHSVMFFAVSLPFWSVVAPERSLPNVIHLQRFNRPRLSCLFVGLFFAFPCRVLPVNC